MLRSKANSGRNLTRWERNQLRRIEEGERLRRRIERQQRNSSKNLCGKIALFLSPFKVLFGFVFLAISLLIISSIIITRLVRYCWFKTLDFFEFYKSIKCALKRFILCYFVV